MFTYVLFKNCRSVEFHQTSDKITTTLTLITYSCFFISTLSDFINLLYLLHHSNQLILFGLFESFSMLGWNLGHIFCYLIYIYRLHHKLQATTNYKLSKITYIIFTILMLLYLSHCIIIGIYSMIKIKTTTLLSNHQYLLDREYYFGAEILDFTISVFLLSLFGNKIYKISAALHKNINNKHKSVILYEQQKLLSSLFSKYFLLSFIGILMCQIVTLTLSLGWLLTMTHKSNMEKYNKYVEIFQHIFHLAKPFDIIVNSICLLLIFDNMEHIYLKFCHRCHSYIQLCCYMIVKKKAIKSEYKLNDKELEISLLGERL
eukprot:106620_1